MEDHAVIAGELDASTLRVGVARSTFNDVVTRGLLDGALEVLATAGATDVTVVEVPGAFELPLVAQRLAAEGYDCVIAIGAVILGETDHYEHIAHRASEGLQRVALDAGIPVAFGVLTAREPGHALARCAPGPGNKGAEAAEAAVRTTMALRKIRSLTREAEARERRRSRTV